MFKPFTLNLHQRIVRIERPQIMGIVNVTPDSFFAGSRTPGHQEICRRVEKMVADGADMIDIGAYSSRPGADDISPVEEMERLRIGLKAVREIAPGIIVSVDTFRADVAKMAVVEGGADIVNDISGGNLDPEMLPTVARLKVPYILMHMRGTPATMQQLTDYKSVTADVAKELSIKLSQLRELGVADVIADPGFGFSKTTGQNYRLLNELEHLTDALNVPLLVGISRKSMIFRPLDITPAEALNGTTVLNTIALLKGASILRVHDVAEARQALTLTSLTTDTRWTHSPY